LLGTSSNNLQIVFYGKGGLKWSICKDTSYVGHVA
jgi:hypothetical protein